MIFMIFCVFIWCYFWCIFMCSCVLFLVRFSRVFCRAFSGVFWWFCWWYFSVLFSVLFFVLFFCVFFVPFIVLFFVHFFVLSRAFFRAFFFVPWAAPKTSNHNILHFGPCFFWCFFWWSLLVKIGNTQYILYSHISYIVYCRIISYVQYRTIWIYLDIYICISCILRRIHRIMYIRLLYSWHCFSMCLHHHYHVCKNKTFAMVAVHQCPCCTIVLFGPYADNLCSSTVSTCNGLPCNNLPCKTRTACENLRVAPVLRMLQGSGTIAPQAAPRGLVFSSVRH